MTLHGAGLPLATPLWHSHEMLIGFGMATVAGFSLTAVANLLLVTVRDVIPVAAILLFFQMGVLRQSIPHLGRFIVGFGCVLVGLALFLFGMDIMTQALKSAAGDYMKEMDRIYLTAEGQNLSILECFQLAFRRLNSR